MSPPDRKLGDRRRNSRMRQTILEWVFPLTGTVGLLIAFLFALFAHPK
jgi:hypothetical protein